MTVFRILPNGARRRLPGGSVRALGASGPRYFDVAGSTTLGVDAGGAALPVVPMVGQTWLSFAIAGALTQSGTIGYATLSIGVSGALMGRMNMRGASLLGVDLLGVLTLSQHLRGSAGIQFVSVGRLLPSIPMRAATRVGVDVIGQLAVASALRGRLSLGINVSGLLSAKAGQKWRDLWRDVYEARQALLNAIDGNNRELAKQAGDRADANATAIVQTNARVTTAEGRITAEANRTTLLESRINSPTSGLEANASGLSALSTSVSLQNGQIAAQALDITKVRASVGATSGNLIANTGFESDTFGWVIASDSLVGNVADSSYKLYRNRNGQRPGGINVLTWQSNTTLSSGTVVIRSNSVPAEAGTRYCVQGAGDRQASSTLSFGIDFLNSSGGVITGGPSVTATPGYVTESAFAVAPTGTVALRLWLRSQVTGAISGPAFSVIRPMVSVAAAEQTTVPPWQPSSGGLDEKYAQVTQQMAVEVDSLGAAKATWGLYLDVNRRVIGMQSINDGVVGELNFMADVFRLMSPAGADGMEIRDGYIRVWKGNSQTITGNSFGAAGQKLMRWFGPNIGAEACTKSNAVTWEDSDGNAYFGGTLSAGVLKNAAQTTVLTNNPTISVGPFSTNGKTKVVTVGYFASSAEFRQYYAGRAESAGPPAPPSNSSPATTVTLARQYAGGSAVTVATVPVAHSASVTNSVYVPADAYDPNLPGGGWFVDYSFTSSASLTYSDTLDGTETFTYSASAGSGSFTRHVQTLSVTSIEQ